MHLVGQNIIHTVFLDDQIKLRQWYGEWMAGILQGTKLSSLIQDLPVKRIHKTTGVKIQMRYNVALVMITTDTKEGGEANGTKKEATKEKAAEEEATKDEASTASSTAPPFCFIITETPVSWRMDGGDRYIDTHGRIATATFPPSARS
jgi:hypothetical protein